MQSDRIDICPICGEEMSVVGKTTMHYECLSCNKEKKRLAVNIILKLGKYFEKPLCPDFDHSCCGDCPGCGIEKIVNDILSEKAKSKAEGVIETIDKILNHDMGDLKNDRIFDLRMAFGEIIDYCEKLKQSAEKELGKKKVYKEIKQPEKRKKKNNLSLNELSSIYGGIANIPLGG